MIRRRTLILGTVAAPAVLLAARSMADAATALATSKLVYLTPLKSNGEESHCKAEVWFAYRQGDVFVVTQANAWRAEAVRQGLTRARLWVGEFGIWDDANGAFRQAPERLATASLITDSALRTSVLAAMQDKYAEDGWAAWGPRFHNGLENGERVMIRYAIDA